MKRTLVSAGIIAFGVAAVAITSHAAGWFNGIELPLRVVRDGRETWLRVKSIDRAAALKKPQMQ